MSGETWIRAVGSVATAGMGVPALCRALAEPVWRAPLGLDRPDADQLPIATCRDFDPKGVLPPLVARRLDRPARLLAVAAHECLKGEGETLPWPRETIGVTAGTWNSGTTSLLEVLRAVFFVSPEEAPPAQFPSTVANAPASQLGILERLGGPNLTFAEKQSGGMRAIIEGARLLRRGRAACVVACGVDEANWLNAEGYDRIGALRRAGGTGMILGEGAAALALAREPGPAPLARLAGWGASSVPAAPYLYPDRPDALVEACQQALKRAELDASQLDAVVSAANGLPALAALETAALAEILGSHRPAAISLSDRLGDGAFASAQRVLIAALVLGRNVVPSWAPPEHLARIGCGPLAPGARAALVTAVAAGGSALTVVLTSQ